MAAWLSKAGKLAMKFYGGFLVRLMRGLCGEEQPKVSTLPPGADSRTPFLGKIMPGNSFESARIVTSEAGVTSIFCLRCKSQIVPSIIQGIVVTMIYFLPLLRAHNEAGHVDTSLPTLGACHSTRIERTCIFIPFSRPLPLVDPFVIVGVNKRKLTLRKWNQAVSWFRRLEVQRYLVHGVVLPRRFQLQPLFYSMVGA